MQKLKKLNTVLFLFVVARPDPTTATECVSSGCDFPPWSASHTVSLSGFAAFIFKLNYFRCHLAHKAKCTHASSWATDDILGRFITL